MPAGRAWASHAVVLALLSNPLNFKLLNSHRTLTLESYEKHGERKIVLVTYYRYLNASKFLIDVFRAGGFVLLSMVQHRLEP